MAIDFVCGWECRQAAPGAAAVPNESHWDNNAGVPAISTSTVRSGTAALRINSTLAALTLTKDIARTTVAGRVYVRWATLPEADLVFLRHANVSGALTIKCNEVGAITTQIGAGIDSATIATVTTGVWYRIDWLAESSTGTASVKLRVDGGTEVTQTQAQVSANMTTLNVGTTLAHTQDVFYDDLVLGTAVGDYPIGEGTVERMKPTRDGTHSFTAGDFAYNTAGGNVATNATDVWSYVDDDDLTSTADLIRQAVVRSTGYVQVGFSTAPLAWDALAVNVVSSWHASTTGADTVGLKLDDGGTLQDMLDEAGDGLSDVSQTTVIVNEKILTAAPSGGVWTGTKLAGLLIRMGYSTDVVGIPYWDGVMLEIAYGPARLAVPYINPMPPLIAQ